MAQSQCAEAVRRHPGRVRTSAGLLIRAGCGISAEHYRMKIAFRLAASAVLLLSLAGCGYTPGQRALTGGGIGASTANRRLVGTGIAAVSEEGGGILSGDAVERGSKRLSKSLDGARSDPPQIGLHLSPARLDRAEVRAVAGQIAIGKA